MQAQHKKGVLKYDVEIVWGHTWEDTLRECIEAGGDSTLIAEARKRLEEFTSKRKEEEPREPSRWEYHFKKNKARIIGDKVYQGKTFATYDIKNNQRIIRRFHKGNLNDFRIDTISYIKNDDEKTYKTQIFTDSTKIINGFECYKILIKEYFSKYNDAHLTYEIFVTDQIHFPLTALTQLPIHITDACPVIIKQWWKDERNHTSWKLVDFDEKLNSKMLKIPPEFKG